MSWLKCIRKSLRVFLNEPMILCQTIQENAEIVCANLLLRVDGFFSEKRVHRFLIYLKQFATHNRLITVGQLFCMASCIFRRRYIEIIYRDVESVDI